MPSCRDPDAIRAEVSSGGREHIRHHLPCGYERYKYPGRWRPDRCCGVLASSELSKGRPRLIVFEVCDECEIIMIFVGIPASRAAEPKEEGSCLEVSYSTSPHNYLQYLEDSNTAVFQ